MRKVKHSRFVLSLRGVDVFQTLVINNYIPETGIGYMETVFIDEPVKWKTKSVVIDEVVSSAYTMIEIVSFLSFLLESRSPVGVHYDVHLEDLPVGFAFGK